MQISFTALLYRECSIIVISARRARIRQKLLPNILGILYVFKFCTMSDENKLAILSAISSNLTPGIPARFSFNSLTKTLNLSKQDIDSLLVELNRNRFISQYVKKGVDGFTLVLNQKGLDAVQDGSFI